VSSDRDRLDDALGHLEKLREYASDYDLGDEVVFDAACMRLSAAIDSLRSLPESARTAASGTRGWAQIWSVRNRIAHGYVFLDQQIILDTIANDLGGFEDAIRRMRDDAAR